jgi:CBS domain-containing protein
MKIPSRHDDPALNMKKILLPVTSFIRLYAIREGITVTGSRERAEQLLDRKIFDATLFEELMQAFDFITHLRISSQAERIARDEAPGNTADTHQLNQIETLTLKKHLQNIASLQTRLSSEFSSTE